jgi:serine/threonine protein kinase
MGSLDSDDDREYYSAESHSPSANHADHSLPDDDGSVDTEAFSTTESDDPSGNHSDDPSPDESDDPSPNHTDDLALDQSDNFERLFPHDIQIPPEDIDVDGTSPQEIFKAYPRKRVPYEQDPGGREFFGGQGKVFKARRRLPSGIWTEHLETFAVKELQPKDRQAWVRLRREINNLCRCKHPNVIQLIEIYKIKEHDWDNVVFLVTQPWADASLGRFIENLKEQRQRRDGFSSLCPWYQPQRLAPWPSIIRQCILGLIYLHQKIKHKDLTPDNILFVDESRGHYDRPRVRVIITDLGISKWNKSEEATTGIGTGRYMAPEQLLPEGKAYSNWRSDIFMLGCCFSWIQAILSSKPWDSDTNMDQGVIRLDKASRDGFAAALKTIPQLLHDLSKNIDGQRPPQSVDFSDTLKSMIISMIHGDPEERNSLETLLGKINEYKTRWPSPPPRKLIDVFTMERSIWSLVLHQKLELTQFSFVKTVDISHVEADVTLFQALRKPCSFLSSKATGLRGIFYNRSIRDIHRVKFIRSSGRTQALALLEEGGNDAECEQYKPLVTNTPIPVRKFRNNLRRPSHIRQGDKSYLTLLPKRLARNFEEHEPAASRMNLPVLES